MQRQDSEPVGGLPPEARQFDFWLGEWDVNLRIRQDDNSWPDRIQAIARIYSVLTRIYSVLKGKAVLELWNSETIRGYSLRYFDPEKQKWVLWLNWPGENRSGGSSLEGSFRHGRGDFFSTWSRDDGTEMISRYSFNDITATTLRWDDGYSSDGGKSWTHNWIMEFTRRADEVRLPAPGSELLTYDAGTRCTADEFHAFDALFGRRRGTMRLVDADGNWKTVDATLDGYPVLDGCAVLSLLRFGQQESLHLHTWNSRQKLFEMSRLDDQPRSPLEVFRGPKSDTTVELTRADGWGDPAGGNRYLWTINRDEIRLEVQHLDQERVWHKVAEAQFPEIR